MAFIPLPLSLTLYSNSKVVLSDAGLRAEALLLLGQLSRDQWSDFNSHDPGITILEQLFFALTMLANYSRGLIVDLLALAVAVVVPAELEVDPALVSLKLTEMGTDVAVRDPPAAVAVVRAGSRRQAAVQQQGGDVSAGGGWRIDCPPTRRSSY